MGYPNKKTEILVDNRWMGTSGIGRYAHEILQRYPNSVTLNYLDRQWSIKNPFSPWLLAHAANVSSSDIFWSPGFIPPAQPKIPFIVTVHDLIHLKHASKLHNIYYQKVIRPLLHTAAKVITVSEFSRQEILQWSGLDENSVIAIHNGVGKNFTPTGEAYNPGFPYILYVGNKREHKNLERLIRAFALLNNSEIRLIFSGNTEQSLLDVAHNSGVGNRVHFLGHIEENDLPSVYRGATCLAFVSLYEGFGLPLLESMACGTPVVTSNTTSLPEVAGDAAVIVNPYSIEDIADGLNKVIHSELIRLDLQKRGIERSQLFSWNKTAENTWKVILEAKDK